MMSYESTLLTKWGISKWVTMVVVEAQASAVLVIFLIVIIAAFCVARGMFGGKNTRVDINVTTPQR